VTIGVCRLDLIMSRRSPALHGRSRPESDPDRSAAVVGSAQSLRSMLPSLQSVRSLRVDEWAVLAAASVLGVNIFDFTLVPSFTPRLAALVVLLPIGMFRIVERALRRDRSAQVAALLVLWSIAAACLSAAPMLSLLGVLGRESSALITAGVIAAWAAARGMSPAGRRDLHLVLAVILVVNAVAGVIQSIVQPDDGLLRLYDGRLTGFLTAPVYFGAAMAAAATWLACSRTSLRLGLLGVVVLAACVNFSGSRFSVLTGFAGVVVGAAIFRDRRWSSAAGFGAAFIGGVVVSRAATDLGGGSSAAERAIEAGGAGRLTAWRYGSKALLEQPIAGWGPGRFREAVQGRFSADFTRVHAADDLTAIWFDAHNIVIELAVTTGLVGLGLAVWFVVLEARNLRCRIGFVLVVFSAPWLVEPAGLASLPLAMLVLGSISLGLPATAAEPERLEHRSRPADLLVLCGALASLLVLVPDLRLKSAVDSGFPNRIASAASPYPFDPVVADLVSSAYESAGDFETAEEWAGRAVERQPDRPYLWVRRGALSLALGDPGGAAEHADRALALHPWNVDALRLRLFVARSGGEPTVDELQQKLCAVAPPNCVDEANR